MDMVEEDLGHESTSVTEEETKAELAKLVRSVIHNLFVLFFCLIYICLSE